MSTTPSLDKMIGLMAGGMLTVEKMTTPLSYAQMCLMGYATRWSLQEYNKLLKPAPYVNLCSAYKRAMATGTSAMVKLHGRRPVNAYTPRCSGTSWGRSSPR